MTPESDRAAAPELVLPGELTIYTVGELHPQWLAWLEAVEAAPDLPAPEAGRLPGAEVRADAVDQVDGAGIQLLVALERAVAVRGRRLVLQAPSAALAGGLAGLGLAGWLAERQEVAA